jgi:transcriptional regulator with XRE-family HTH domain
MTMTGVQAKAARTLLGWSLLELGYRARVSDPTITAFEKVRRPIRPEMVLAIQRAFEAAGIVFDDDGQSVRLREGKP